MAEQQPQQPGTQMISPTDYRVYTVPTGQEEAYKAAGYVTTQPSINRQEIKEQFQGITGAGHSFLISTVAGIPFAKSAISAASTPEEAAAWKESFDAAEREHPVLDFLGKTTGTVGAVAATAATGGVAAEALGLGGAAAAGASASAGASPSLLSLAAPTIRGAAIKGAVTNMALGHIARIDDSALAHAADPYGKEKIQWGLNSDDMIDAAFGAAIPASLGVVGKSLGYIGKKLGSGGMDLMQKAITNASKIDSVERQGRLGDLRAKLEEVIRVGRKNPSDYVKSRVKIAGSDMEDLKAAIGYAELNPLDTHAVKTTLRQTLGKNDRLYRRIADFLAKDTWTVDDMQKINKKVYAEIEHDELGYRPKNNARYMNAANVIKNGMNKIFQDNDPTHTGAMAQKWAAAMKEESDWLLAKAVVKRGNGPKGVAEIINEMGSGAATGFLAGSMFGAFGGAGPAAAGSAAYKAVNSLNAFHYGKAASALGKAFGHIDDKLTSAVEAGLYGLPSQLHQLHTRAEYQTTAAKLSAIRNDPQTAFTNIASSLTERGVPEHMAEDAALATHTQTQWLASKLPSRMTAPDVASNGHGDPVQQRRLMGQVRTMRDPTYGLLYPNKTNMEVLQQFYPNVLFNAQQAVLSQLQRNPNLPAASKLWASRIVGRPMNNLSSPAFSSMLQQARHKQVPSEQQQQQMPSARSSRTQRASEATRMDQLQGGGE